MINLNVSKRKLTTLVKAISAGIISETVNTTLLEAEQKRKITKQLIAEKVAESDSMHVARDLIKSYVDDLPSTLNKNPMLGKSFLSTVLDAVILEPGETSWIIKLLRMKHPHGNGECRSVSHKDILSNESISAPALLLKS